MKYSIPLELITLEPESLHLAVPCTFPNGGIGLWILDTGASKTVFDLSLTSRYDPLDPEIHPVVRSAGIGTGMFTISLGILHPFCLGKLTINPFTVALIDLSQINHLIYHAANREICGLIGSDFLLEYKAVIDYSRLSLCLSPQAKKKS